MIIELFLLALFAIPIFHYLKAWRIYQLTKNIPAEISYPVIGHAYMILRIKKISDMSSVYVMVRDKYMEYGITKAWCGPLLIIAIFNPEYIQVIANSEYSMNKGEFFYQIVGDLANGVFITSGGKKWKELKKPLAKALTKTMVVSDYHLVMVRRCNEYVQYIRDHKLGIEFDIFQNMTNLALDILSETVLGVKTNEVIDNKFNFVENLHTYIESEVLNSVKCLFYFKKLGEHFSHVGKTLQRSKREINKFLQWVFDERMKSNRICKGSTEYYSDFLLRRAFEKELSFEDIRKELVDLVIAGSDSSSVVASSALAYMAMFPHIQEKAYQEQLSIFGHSKRDVSADDLDSMPYLKMVVKETLRLIGNFGFIRTASEDIKLDKYTLPKGSTLFIGLQVLHQHIKYWEKPKEFYPEHFLPEKEAERPAYAYIPFGITPRVCPGFIYGMNSIMVILSTLLRNFEIKTRMKYEDIEFDYKLLIHFVGGYNVKFIERNKL